MLLAIHVHGSFRFDETSRSFDPHRGRAEENGALLRTRELDANVGFLCRGGIRVDGSMSCSPLCEALCTLFEGVRTPRDESLDASSANGPGGGNDEELEGYCADREGVLPDSPWGNEGHRGDKRLKFSERGRGAKDIAHAQPRFVPKRDSRIGKNHWGDGLGFRNTALSCADAARDRELSAGGSGERSAFQRFNDSRFSGAHVSATDRGSRLCDFIGVGNKGERRQRFRAGSDRHVGANEGGAVCKTRDERSRIGTLLFDV